MFEILFLLNSFFFVNIGSLSLKEWHFLNKDLLPFVSWTLYQSHILNLDILPILSWTLYDLYILNLVPFVSLNQYNPVTYNKRIEWSDWIIYLFYFIL